MNEGMKGGEKKRRGIQKGMAEITLDSYFHPF